ncbi:hypothetical protein DFH07DRAFT_1024091 [Mycena maculata]|uniref:Uncharacterized protein n=1 Tax=Mycena maculata TaxID=230809 RepID=A0AAD7NG92_9AGAR|nr:hypothetical protein DFH07DRAFT_1024091 [Mycena maculata]
MQSSLVLNGAYCDVVRGQLAAQEENRKKKTKGRLVGDGLPRLLTSAAFVERVIAFHNTAAKKAVELENRKVARVERAAAMAEWKELDTTRKTRNDEIRAQWKIEVLAWEAERDHMKALHKRPGWKKPTLKGLLFLTVPKPTFISGPSPDGNEPAGDHVSAVGSGSDSSSDSGDGSSDDY